MFPNLSRADCDVIERRYRELQAGAARRRRAADVPAAARGRDWGVVRYQALIGLSALLIVVLLLTRF